MFDATNPDLSGFAKAGHKLILWQGMGDTNVLPAHAVLYYTALRNQMGAKTVDGFVRFYALPGVYHCGGGDGPVISNVLAPLMLWVERGIAPEALAGIHVPRPERGPGPMPPAGQGGANEAATQAAAADLTRPIYPYPYIAKYTGHGSVREAANFVRGPARPAPDEITHWLGSSFYEAQPLQWCTGDSSGLTCKTSR